jgi:hypothetical protein
MKNRSWLAAGLVFSLGLSSLALAQDNMLEKQKKGEMEMKDKGGMMKDKGNMMKDKDAMMKDKGGMMKEKDAMMKDKGGMIKEEGNKMEKN